MKTKIIICLSFIFCFNRTDCQSIALEFLPMGTSNSCTNISDGDEIQCYDIKYVPSVTGTLTSYTLGFLATCIESGSAFIESNSTSCVMTDNSSAFDGCDGFGLFLMNLSGNTGNTSITAGESISLHQVCFTVPLGETIDVIEDSGTGLTFSIDSIDSGAPIDDLPTFADELLYNESDCEFTEACTIEFGTTANTIEFETLVDGTIANGATLNNSLVPSQSFDIFDELNMSCVSPGGVDDITFNFQILNTLDLNGNGLIDDFAGIEHQLIQTADGITGSIPFNTSDDSESSAGDIRGYSIEVHFAEFVNINAHQLSVMIDGVNSNSQAFESAALLFLEKGYVPFGSATHQGYFDGENDLTGNCNSTTSSPTFIKGGTGVVLFQDSETVDLTLPCSPIAGTDGANDILDVNARTHGGLDSMTLIGGFKLIVIGEDVAAPTSLDDGSGNAPEDNIRANAKTNTVATLTALIKGIKIIDCVQFQTALPLDWEDFDAKSNDDNVDLHWSTSNEVNTDFFEVLWSPDGKEFSKIAIVDSKNKIGTNEYFYKHTNPRSGENYYKIKQIDLDGRFIYSEIKNISIQNKRNTINIFPNPTSDVLNISGLDVKEKDVMVKIYDATGSLSYEGKLFNNKLNTSILSNGLHTILIMTEASVTSLQFFKS